MERSISFGVVIDQWKEVSHYNTNHERKITTTYSVNLHNNNSLLIYRKCREPFHCDHEMSRDTYIHNKAIASKMIYLLKMH